MESKKPPISRKSIAGQLLFVVALLIIARIVWTRNQPERLTTPRISSNYKIVGEDLYGLGSATWAIQTQSIHGSKTRTLVPEDPTYPFYSQSNSSELSIVEGMLYYIVKARSSVSSQPSTFQGYHTFLLSPKDLPGTPNPRQKRMRRTQYPPSAAEIRIKQIPLQGGTPQEVATFHSDNICLIGNHVFWIRPEAEESEMVSQGMAWWEATAHSDLMLTSLPEGTTRCIQHGIYRYTTLKPQAAGISWTDLAPYPTQPTLLYANASDGVVHSLAPLKNQRLNLGVLDLLELGSRLYWNNNEVLMSSNLDGTDMREVFKPSEKHLVPYMPLFSYRNSLYFYLQDGVHNPKDQPQSYLCRLHPGQSDPVEIVRKLPSLTNYTPFGGYLYFGRQEKHRSPWAALTNDDASETTEYVLCRIPMKP